MAKRVRALPILLLSLSLFSHLSAQEMSPAPYFIYGKGLGMISPDSLYMLNIRFRMQNRLALTTRSREDLAIDEVEARVRRLRLRFDGFIYTPKLSYVLQLAFSRGDMDYDDTGFPNIVRDAMVLYSFNKHFTIGIGQTKLPGNRQRVVSSGDLQLPDRSLVNSTFNIDRDFGVQVYYTNDIQGFYYLLRGALSSGEGRNITSSDRGLAYTGRVELLPLGIFTNGGDYFEGDLVREKKPKISVGLTYSNNQNAIRTGGQLGRFLYEARDIETRMADFLLKYNGWAFSTEFIQRISNNPITSDEVGNLRYVYAGHGRNFQSSYLFKSDVEIVGRYSVVAPFRDIELLEQKVSQYTVGATKYLRGHRVKLQTDLTYETNQWRAGEQSDNQNWQIRFQVEVGI